MTRAARGRARAAALVALFATGALAVWASAADQSRFPHEEHAGLFPLCTGCHTGIPEGDPAAFYPEPSQCAGCHDGSERERVTWTGPDRAPDNVAFEHPGHAAEVARRGDELTCVTCHTDPGAPRMAVEMAVAERCLSCHEHEAARHYVDADCARCHIPLAGTAFGVRRVLALPLPEDHDGGFVAERHGELAAEELARCETCHTRERCIACHVNAATVPEIGRTAAAGPSLALPSFPAHYPVPRSHEATGWIEAHGAVADVASCSTCHTRDDCAACHVAPAPGPVQALPSRAAVRAPGTLLTATAPPSHATPLFAAQHGTQAAADGASCSACHARSFCEDCHQGASGAEKPAQSAEADGAAVARLATTGSRPPGRSSPAGAAFHPPDFILRHGAPGWNRRLECSNCHDTRRFCRDCHEGAGMQTFGRLTQGFHDAEPLWLFRHPQAARQGLESCTACHTQQDCMQCHSTLGSFQVNPHGSGFDARRAQKRNAAVCLACHIGDPLNRRSP